LTIASGSLAATSYTSSFRRHEDQLRRRAIEHNAQIELTVDCRRFLDEQPLHLLTLRAGLVGDQLHAENVLGVLFCLIDVLRDLYAATLAASAGVDLRLHHDAGRAAGKEAFANFNCFVESVGDLTPGNGHAVLRKNVFCLIFVNFHKESVCVIA
jgi:hypothetical protein